MSGSDQNTGAPQRANRLLLGKLYEKTSQAGQRFFIGSLGFLKVLVFHDDKAESGNEWNFYVVERTQDEIRQRQEYVNNKQSAQPAPQQNAVGQSQSQYGNQTAPRQGEHQPPQHRQLPPEGNPGRQQFDDSIPF
jgi:hypothetical protein